MHAAGTEVQDSAAQKSLIYVSNSCAFNLKSWISMIRGSSGNFGRVLLRKSKKNSREDLVPLETASLNNPGRIGREKQGRVSKISPSNVYEFPQILLVVVAESIFILYLQMKSINIFKPYDETKIIYLSVAILSHHLWLHHTAMTVQRPSSVYSVGFLLCDRASDSSHRRQFSYHEMKES